MIHTKQVEKDLLILGAIGVSGYKLDELIADYNKEAIMKLNEANMVEGSIDGLIKGLANECYTRLKKKFK